MNWVKLRQPDRIKRTGKRLNRMEFRPLKGNLTTNITKLGKRQMRDVLEENCEAASTTLHQK